MNVKQDFTKRWDYICELSALFPCCVWTLAACRAPGWLGSQGTFHGLSCLWGQGWLWWRTEGNVAFFQGAVPSGWEQWPWKENKDENNHRSLWHSGRLRFLHQWLFYVHIRRSWRESWGDLSFIIPFIEILFTSIFWCCLIKNLTLW